MGQAQINVRTWACSRTSIARTKQAALTHNVRGKELKCACKKRCYYTRLVYKLFRKIYIPICKMSYALTINQTPRHPLTSTHLQTPHCVKMSCHCHLASDARPALLRWQVPHLVTHESHKLQHQKLLCLIDNFYGSNCNCQLHTAILQYVDSFAGIITQNFIGQLNWLLGMFVI